MDEWRDVLRQAWKWKRSHKVRDKQMKDQEMKEDNTTCDIQ